MQKRKISCVALGGTVCLVVPLLPVRADIKYTQVTSMPMDGDKEAAKPLSTVTTYVRQGEQRTDTVQQIGPAKMNEISLTNCAKKQIIRMDTALKIYTLDSIGGGDTAGTGNDKGTANAASTQGTGKMVSTVAVQPLGVETVAGYQARHSMITTRLQASGCAGDSDMTLKQEVWVADVPMPAFDCSVVGYSAAQYVVTKNDCKMSFEQKGEIEAYAAAMKGVVVRMKMYDGKTGKVTMIQETTMVSLAKLEDGEFTVPDGFKQLNATEYQNARQQAMIKAITGAATAGGDQEEKNDDATVAGNKNEAEEPGKGNEGDAKGQAKDAGKGKVRKKLKLPF